MDVIGLLEQNGIPYQDRGDCVRVKCLNPAHNDKHPSMDIRKEDGVFHCWSCGFKGNYYTLCHLFNTPFERENYKFTVPVRVPDVEYPAIKIIGDLNDPFDNEEVMKFLRSIGVIDDSFIEKYQVKYTIYAEMIAEHLYNNPDVSFTKMRERICIPIFSDGKRINMECRTYIGEVPKVKYVKGGSVDTLFNWDNIDIHKPVVSTESVKNFCKIWNVYPNTVALFHAIPTKKQLEMLNTCDELIHFGDNDAGFFGEKKNGMDRKGTLQALANGYKKDFKICWDKRTYRKFDADKGGIVRKGYDANDCTLDEISNHIDKAIWYSEYVDAIEGKSNKIVW